MSLHGTMVQIDSLEKCVQGHIAPGQQQCKKNVQKERKEDNRRWKREKRRMNEEDKSW